ncbi:MAG: SCO family protein [Gammaproteobacteria bacterium]
MALRVIKTPSRSSFCVLRFLFVACLLPAGGEAGATLERDVAFARSQSAVGNTLRNHSFADTEGRVVQLASLRGEPTLVSMVYTSCPDTCSVVTRRLRTVVDIAREAMGEDAFSVITIGFDAGVDTPSRMRSYARTQGAGDGRWSFLAGDAATIEAISEDIGFSFVRSARGFDHLAQISIVDADNRLYRQVYGDTFDPPSIIEPLKELVSGTRMAERNVAGWVESLRLLCTVYDPASGRYAFDYSLFVAAAVGVACLGWLAWFLVGAWREHRRPV